MKIDTNTTLKRLRNHYQLVVMNEDTYEEVVKFKLTRTSVYVAMSTLFVLMISITVALIIFTPLKYYLPGAGYGSAKELKELKLLKMRTDSMENALRHQNKFNEDIRNVLQGNVSSLDTTLLNVPGVETSED